MRIVIFYAVGLVLLVTAGSLRAQNTEKSRLLMNTYSFEVIDEGNDKTADVSIIFGSELAEEITFERSEDRFEFSDDVFVPGSLKILSRGSTPALLLESVGENAPHISFGSEGIFDTKLFRSAPGSLETSGNFFVAAELHTDTFNAANDQIIMRNNGTTIFNERGQPVFFRIESENEENLLFVHGATDRIGIGTSNPRNRLDVDGTVAASQLRVRSQADSPFLVLSKSENDPVLSLSAGPNSPEGRISAMIGSLYIDTITGLTYRKRSDSGNVDWELLQTAVYPLQAMLWHEQSLPVNGEMKKRFVDGQQYAVSVQQQPAKNGSTFSQTFVLERGMYRFDVLGIREPSSGKIDWYVNDEPIVQGQEWYSADVRLNTEQSIVVTIPTSGRHTLRGVVNGKHAGSTGHQIHLTRFSFTRQ